MLGLLFNANAQDTQENEYLIDIANVKFSGFGNTHAEFSMVDGAFAYSSGAGGAFLFNYKFYFGLYTKDTQTKHLREDIYQMVNDTLILMNRCNRIRFNHGGLWLGYVHNPSKLWHVGTNLRIGSGRIALFDKDIEFSEFDEHHRDLVTVITPEIDFEVNLVRWCKFAASVGYRFVLGVDNDTYLDANGVSKPLFETNQFSSPVASVKFLFGGFGPRKNGRKAKIKDIENN